jgi:hypothetical protein
VQHRSSGPYGRDGYFAAVAVPGSTWRSCSRPRDPRCSAR